MASWHSLPFELKAQILNYCISTAVFAARKHDHVSPLHTGRCGRSARWLVDFVWEVVPEMKLELTEVVKLRKREAEMAAPAGAYGQDWMFETIADELRMDEARMDEIRVWRFEVDVYEMVLGRCRQ